MSSSLQTRYLQLVSQLGSNPAAALTGLEALLAEAPDFAAGWNSLGLLRLHVGNAGGAAKAFAQAARHSPTSAPIQLNLARALAAQGKAREALQNYWQALTLDPSQAEAWRQALGHVRSLREPAAERDFFVASLGLVDTPAQREYLAEHLGAYAPRLAAELLKVALASLKQQSAGSERFEILASLAQGSGQEALAYEAHLQILRLQPKSLDTLAELFRLAPEPEAKRGFLEQAIRLSPRDPFLHFSLAKVLIQCQDYESALTHAEKALQLRPALAPRIASSLIDTANRLTPFRRYGQHSLDKILLSRRYYDSALAIVPSELDYMLKRALIANLLLPASPDYVRAEALAAELVARYPVDHAVGSPSQDNGHYYELAAARFELGHAAGPGELIDFKAFDVDASLSLLELPALEWHRPLPAGEQPVIFQASDSETFIKHTLPQILSLVQLGLPYRYHVHSFSPDARIAPLIERLSALLPLSWSSENIAFASADEARFYAESIRFSRLAQLMQEAPATYINLNPRALFTGKLADLLTADDELALLAYPQAMSFDRYSSHPVMFAPTPAVTRLLAGLDRFLRHHPVRHPLWKLDQFALYCGIRRQAASLKLRELRQAELLRTSAPTDEAGPPLWVPNPNGRNANQAYIRRKAELRQTYGFEA